MADSERPLPPPEEMGGGGANAHSNPVDPQPPPPPRALGHELGRDAVVAVGRVLGQHSRTLTVTASAAQTLAALACIEHAAQALPADDATRYLGLDYARHLAAALATSEPALVPVLKRGLAAVGVTWEPPR